MDNIETVKGKIIKILFQKDNYSAMVVETLSEIPCTITCAGNITEPKVGETLVFCGKFIEHKKYGKQFSVAYTEIDTDDLLAVRTYLVRYIKGVGKKTAKKIVDTFEGKTFDIIRNNPERLVEAGVSEKKIPCIVKSFSEQQVFFEVYKLFNGAATPNQIAKIYGIYHEKSVEVLRSNPYCVIYDVEGMGFASADKLAISMGIPESDIRRVRAAICYALKSQQNDGHCFCGIDELYTTTNELLKQNITRLAFLEAVKLEYKEKHIAVESDKIYAKNLYQSEVEIAERVLSLFRTPLPRYPGTTLESILSTEERLKSFVFATAQREAITCTLNNRISYITGNAGTGKSTIVKMLVKAYNAEKYGNVIMLAPTGRAAKRMTETTEGLAQGRTIHSFLLRSDEEEKIEGKHFIVDEASMIDLPLARALLNKVGLSSTIVFLGDVDQLPPIGAGLFFHDIIRSGVVPGTKLEVSHRFGGLIAHNASAINRGEPVYKLREGPDFHLCEVSDEDMKDKIIKTYIELAKKYDLSSIQCIVPYRKKGSTCANELNEILEKHMNTRVPTEDDDKLDDFPYRIGDRVVNTVNTTDSDGEPVNNGDCGYITDISSEDKYVQVALDDGREVKFDNCQYPSLQLAYVLTVHKSQGSQYKAVILGMGMQHYVMLNRNMLYTAVTRAKTECYIIGQKKALSIAIQNVKPVSRRSMLFERIAEICKNAKAN